MKWFPRGPGLWLACLLVLIWIAVAIRMVWVPHRPAPEPLERISIGTTASERSALVWVAEDLGLFRNSGLDVTIKTYEAGLLATREVGAGNLDVATAAEFVVVNENMQSDRPDLRIIGVINRTDDIRIVARRDVGITNISDLAGKRVGVLLGTDANFFLTFLCVLNRVQRTSLKAVNLNPSWQIEALTSGSVDAICVWEPFASQAEQELGPNAVSWSGQNKVPTHWVLVCTGQGVTQRTVAVQRLLRALLAAEEFVAKDKAQAREIVQRRLRRPSPPHWWDGATPTVALDRSLVLAMEARAQWIQSTSPGTFPKIPNVLNYFAFEALKAVRPERVTIVH